MNAHRYSVCDRHADHSKNPFSLAPLRDALARRVAWLLALTGACLLAGCASTLTTSVTQFQRWPALPATAAPSQTGQSYQTYRMAAMPNSVANALEYQTYADMIRAAIGPVGLTEARENEAPRFVVSFEYAAPMRQILVERWNDPWFPYPWWSYGRYRGGWGWGWGGSFYMHPVTVPVQAFDNTLTVSIQDATNDTQVFRTTARATTLQPQLNRVMPYLVRAVFDDFPGNNGQNREIKYEWEKE